MPSNGGETVSLGARPVCIPKRRVAPRVSLFRVVLSLITRRIDHTPDFLDYNFRFSLIWPSFLLPTPPFFLARPFLRLTSHASLFRWTPSDVARAGVSVWQLQYCGDKFSVEPVDVTYDDSGETQTTPLMSTRTEKASVKEICSIIGVEVGGSVRTTAPTTAVLLSSCGVERRAMLFL